MDTWRERTAWWFMKSIRSWDYKYRNWEFWCRGYYVGYSRKECKEDRRVYKAPIGRGPGRGTTDDGKLLWKPVYGQVRSHLTQLADRTCGSHPCAVNIGLCRHLKYHRLRRWMIISLRMWTQKGNRTGERKRETGNGGRGAKKQNQRQQNTSKV